MSGSLVALWHVLPGEIKVYYWAARAVYASPWFYLFVAAILAIEWVWPAVREQRVVSVGLVQDFLWFNLDLAFKAAALPAFIGVLHAVYVRVTGGWVLLSFAGWPVAAKVAVSFVVFDFLQWAHHRVRHRFTVLWHFHIIHHSQRQLNLFTDVRVHFVEYLVAQTLIFIPMFMLSLSPFAILGVGIATSWYTRFIHANVRTNLGPLRHLLVTPQFHRIHHSIEPRHQDHNFGVILTVWDRLFGTLYPAYDEYPATGVSEIVFAPKTRSLAGWLGDYGRQLLFPFRALRGR